MSVLRLWSLGLALSLGSTSVRAQHSAGSLPGGPALEGLPPAAAQAFDAYGAWLRSEEGLAVVPDADLAFLRSLDLSEAETRQALSSLAERAASSLGGMRRLGLLAGEDRRAAGRRLADELRAAKAFAAEQEAESAWLEASAAVREKVDTAARLQALAERLEARSFYGEKVVQVRNGISAYLEALGTNASKAPSAPSLQQGADALPLERAPARSDAPAETPAAPAGRAQGPDPALATRDGLLDLLDSLEIVFDRHHWTKRGLAADLRRAIRSARSDGRVRIVDELVEVKRLRPELKPTLNGLEAAILSLAANAPGKQALIDELEVFFEALEDAANRHEAEAIIEGVRTAVREARAVRYVRTGGFFFGAFERRPDNELLDRTLRRWGLGFAEEASLSVPDLAGARTPKRIPMSYVTGLLFMLASTSAGADNERVLDPASPIGPLPPGALADVETMIRALVFFVVMTLAGAVATAVALALKRRCFDGDRDAGSDLPGLGMIGAVAGAAGSLVVLYLR